LSTLTEEFRKLPRGGQKTVREYAERLVRDGMHLDVLPEDKNIFITPHPIVAAMLRPGEPRYIIISIHQGLPQDVRNQLYENAVEVFRWVFPGGGIIPSCHRSNDGNATQHYGRWSHYNMLPYFTKDSFPKTIEGQRALDCFLGMMKTHITPIVSKLLGRYEPELIRRLWA